MWIINLGKTYDLIDKYQLDEWNYAQCDHCGRPIKNICEIESEDKQIYWVWSQCVKKLLELDWSDYWKNKEIEKHINNYFNWLRLIKKAHLINANSLVI